MNMLKQRISVLCLLPVLVLSALFSGSAGFPVSCSWYPSDEYMDVAMQCLGATVTSPPRALPATLTHLRLTSTGLTTLDDSTFQGRHLPVLSSLHITHGVLRDVRPGALCSLTSLDQLKLSNNKLELLDTMSFACTKSLRSLDLSGNPTLSHFPRLVSSSIETLYAESCSLTGIDAGDLDDLPALKKLYLAGNAGLNCSSTKSRLSVHRPGLSIICEGGTSSSTITETSTASSISNMDYLTDNTDDDTDNASTSPSWIGLYIFLLTCMVGTVLCFSYSRKYLPSHFHRY